MQLESMLSARPEFEVVGHAENGAVGIKKFSQLKPDLVLLDLVMPIMNGIQALRAIRRMDPESKVIIVSSKAGSDDTVLEALRLGALGVVTKPVDETRLLDLVGDAIRGDG